MNDEKVGESSKSAGPVFKKRNRPRNGNAGTRADLAADVKEEPSEEEIPLDDLIALHSAQKVKSQGINAVLLNDASAAKKKKRKVTGQEESQKTPQTEKNPLRISQFQGETDTIDVNKHMMEYIEQEMQRKRRKAEVDQDEDGTETPIVIAEKKQQNSNANNDNDIEEGSIALSSSMLNGVPEVDLGMKFRMQNIEATAKAAQSRQAARSAQMDSATEENNHDAARFAPISIAYKDAPYHHQKATDSAALEQFKNRQRMQKKR